MYNFCSGLHVLKGIPRDENSCKQYSLTITLKYPQLLNVDVA